MKSIKGSRNGKILKVKTGYNPNSSSVGSQIPQLFGFFALSGLATIFVMHFIRRVSKKLKREEVIPNHKK